MLGLLLGIPDKRSDSLVGFADFPRKFQFTSYTCGPCCVYAITSFFGVDVSYREVYEKLKTDSDGTAEAPVIRFLRSHGMRVGRRPKMSWRDLVKAIATDNVVMVGLDGDHYGVVYAIDEKEDTVYLSDPSWKSQLFRESSISQFEKRWNNEGLIIRPRSL